MSHINVSRDGSLAIVELNRPAVLNAVATRTLQQLLSAFQTLRVDESVHGVLLTGAENVFAAGADLVEIASLPPLEATRFAELGQTVCLAMERLGKPLLAAVSGYALGAGLELALACDFVLAAEDAVFGFKEIEYGIIPGFGGTQRLPRLVGKSKAKELLFTAESVGAVEALRLRLVNRVYPAQQLRQEALSLLTTICSRGRLSLRLAKEVIDAGSDVNLAAACLMERDAFAVCFATEDQKEGMGAFVEKRKARFKGK
ncbi:MAG TPA: enoyl-CoA hydratase-related protein [Desulfuromonadales bacterium]|nr:enoyl-CoA hydratase-related protein [Desulfuromonadales bacterium]